MKTWIIKDNEIGKILRYRSHHSDPDRALASYLYSTSELTPSESREAADDFNGEIWSETDIQDVPTPERTLNY